MQSDGLGCENHNAVPLLETSDVKSVVIVNVGKASCISGHG